MKTRQRRKPRIWKIVLIVLAVIVIGAGLHGSISYYLMSGARVDNGRETGAQAAQVTDAGVPAKYEAECENGGTIAEIDYTVELYSDPNQTASKHAYVYLPSGYSAENSYDVLYLYHGSGEDESQWLVDNPTNKNVVDNLIYYGDIEPLIIVTPSYFQPRSFGFEDNRDYTQLAYELRNDLIPAVEAAYSTFACGDTSAEGLTASREHRAMAGLSRGAWDTLNVGMMQSLDIMSWFGYFSGSDQYTDEISAALHSEEFEPYPVSFLMAVTGRYDMPPGNPRYEILQDTMSRLEGTDTKLTEGDNYCLVDVVNGGHNMATWEVALYDFLLTAFR